MDPRLKWAKYNSLQNKQMEEKSKQIFQVRKGIKPYVEETMEDEEETTAELVDTEGTRVPLCMSHGSSGHPKSFFQTKLAITRTKLEQLDPKALDKLKSISLMIGIPAYAGQLVVKCADAMITAIYVLEGLGVACEPVFMETESLIPRGRNTFMAEFLGSGATHFLFIDADIGFDVDAILRLLLANKDVVAGVYPLKYQDWDKLKKYIRSVPDPDSSIPAMEQICAGYVYNFDPNKKGRYENGFMEVMDAPTGFMMLTKKVVQFLTRKHPELQYINDIPHSNTERSRGNFFALFDTMIHPETRRYLSEDYGFCYLCRKNNVPIWIDIMSEFIHMGVKGYRGHLLKKLTFEHLFKHHKT